jgi:hypothetical protein
MNNSINMGAMAKQIISNKSYLILQVELVAVPDLNDFHCYEGRITWHALPHHFCYRPFPS